MAFRPLRIGWVKGSENMVVFFTISILEPVPVFGIVLIPKIGLQLNLFGLDIALFWNYNKLKDSLEQMKRGDVVAGS